MTMKRRRRDLRTISLYAARMLREFRGTLVALAGMVLFGGILFRLTLINGQHPPLLQSFYAAWMLMFAQGTEKSMVLRSGFTLRSDATLSITTASMLG